MLPKTQKVATKTLKGATLINRYIIQILLNTSNHRSYLIIEA